MGGRDISRSGILTLAAFGLSALAMAVPMAWVSRARMAAMSMASGVLRASAPQGQDTGTTEELARLRSELIRLEDERRRLQEELARVLDFRTAAARAKLDLDRFVEAFVIGYAVNWQQHSFLVDKGSEHGITPRSGCLRGGAVVGVVVEVGPKVSRVAMLNERGIQVAARTLETRRTGLVVGTGDGCEMRYVPRWAGSLERPRVGEAVVTAERMGFFPAGFLIGHVAMVGETPESLHLSIAVRTAIEDPPEGRVWLLRPAPQDIGSGEAGQQ